MRRVASALSLGAGLGAVAVAALDAVPEWQPTSRLAAVAACGIPYLPLPSAVACAGMVVAGRSQATRMIGAAGLGAALVAGYLTWRGNGGTVGPPQGDDDFTVLSANVLYGRADVRQLAALARGADIVAVQENTPSFEAELNRLIEEDFPHRAGTSSMGADGTMIWSRTPLDLVGFGDTDFASVVVATTVRGVRWTVADVHPVPPQRGSRRWEGDAGTVLNLLRPHVTENLVVVGDFNAIEEHLTMRRLAQAGLRNAMAGWQAPGAGGWQPSWPTDKPFVPPLIRIDHALHSDSVAAWRPRYVVVSGSDHKAVVATFRPR